MMLRVGLGFDVHRLAPGRRLVIGGVEVDSPLGPVAHSDGDVLLHALIDALLGACAKGDIGERFPDTDPRFRDADSACLVSQVLADLPEIRGILNVDAVILLDMPALGARKAAIAARIATLLGEKLVGPVSIKAKRFEGLLAPDLPTGQADGPAIAAQVVLLMEVA